MKQFTVIISLLLILTACNSENSKGKIFSLESMQHNSIEYYSMGEEKFAVISQMYEDKSNGSELKYKISKLKNTSLEIDQITGIQIQKIERLKKNFFKSLGENLNKSDEKSILYYNFENEKKCKPILYNFSNVKFNRTGNIFNQKIKKSLIGDIRDFRKNICKLIASSSFTPENEKEFFFIDPKINQFKNYIDFSNQFDKEIINSKISIEDLGVIKEIYRLLSKTDKHWENILQNSDSWIDDISVLIAIENEILQARTIALSTILYRTGCCGEYGFTKILPLVYGPSMAQTGDTLELQVLMAAYNGDKNPIIELDGNAKIIGVKDGIGTIQVIVPNSKNFEVNGKITIVNKSGIPKTNNWSHEIKVLSK